MICIYIYINIQNDDILDPTLPKEKDLQALPTQVPSNVAEKKSFTIKPPQDCSGSGTIGILFLELIIQT